MPQRLMDHDRAKVRPADADIDHMAHAPAGVARPLAAPDSVGELGHLVEHRVDLRHDVLAVHHDGCVTRRAQSHVQHGAVFRDVESLTAEHSVDPRLQAGLLRQFQQESQGSGGDAVLRVIEIQSNRFGRQALAAFGIVGEERAEMQVSDLLIVAFQRLPCRARREKRDAGRHTRIPLVWHPGVREPVP